MKRCPTCQKEFADSMRFCQTDGTPLVEEAADPFKTMVGSKDDIAAAIPPAAPAPPPVDPFKTMIGGAFAKPDESGDLLQLPEEESPDQMKTMISQGNMGKVESKFEEKKEEVQKPASPFEDSAPKSASTDFGNIPPPEMPKFSEPDLSPSDFGGSSSDSATLIKDYSAEQNAPKVDSNPFSNESANQLPFNQQPQQPPSAIPSPFDLSMPPGYLPPSMSPFGEPQQSPPKKEPAPPPFSYNEPPQQQTPFNQNPFDQPPQNPFGNQQIQPTEWTPPPAPEASWQNQDIGQNTPFAPPVAGAQGQNQTLAIVSLVLGLLSIPCCGFVVFGIAALVTGFLAKKKADENPSEYGGRGLALAGMIVGGITTVIGLILLVLQILFGVLTNLG